MSFDFLLKLPPVIQYTIVWLSFLTLIFGLRLLVKKGFIFRKNGNNFSFNLAHKYPKDHSVCPNRTNVLPLLERLEDISNEKYELTKIRLIRQQMMYGETASTEAVNLLTNIYTRALRERNVPDPIMSISGRVYGLIMCKVFHEMKRRFKVFVINNHMLEKSEEEFSRYVLHNTKEFILNITHMIDTSYICTTDLTSTELSSINRKHIPELSILFKEAFYNAREVSREIKEISDDIDIKKEKLLKVFN